MTLLLRHLRAIKVLPPPPLIDGSDIGLTILEHQGFLQTERGLLASTIGKYVQVVHRFLSHCFPDGKLYLKKLQARHVTDFVLQDVSERGQNSAQLVATVFGFPFSKRADNCELGSGGAFYSQTAFSGSAPLGGGVGFAVV